ncbi:MAG: MipA/OmpV family protein [Gammaproteobacteria bacterium]|nr:MipA/OmpV family protein [Gammaproteobacteria bacterium]
MKKVLSLFLLVISISSYAEVLNSVNEPKWELGIGLGGLSLPHYRGSDQRAEYISPIPYVRYNGERFKVDREGGRFYFYNSEDVKVDVSMAFALQVDSDDNRARAGMTDLGHIIEIGPRIQFNLYQSEDNNFRFRFALPLRTAFSTDFSETENIGWVLSPYLQLRYFNHGWESAISVGPTWASEDYNNYFYKVASEYETVERPSYTTQAGYSGSRITVTISKRFDKIFFGLFARYDNLDNAIFIDSPLIKQRDSFTVGAALSWVFKSSKR